MSLVKNINKFVDATLIDLGRQFRWSYLPPLMIYVAAGISGLTGIVGIFFIKDYLNLSAAFLAGLGFWAGIPWALKMPLGHLVDLIWSRKNYLVFVGASLITLSIIIMYSLIVHTEFMASILKVEIWFIVNCSASLYKITGNLKLLFKVNYVNILILIHFVLNSVGINFDTSYTVKYIILTYVHRIYSLGVVTGAMYIHTFYKWKSCSFQRVSP